MTPCNKFNTIKNFFFLATLRKKMGKGESSLEKWAYISSISCGVVAVLLLISSSMTIAAARDDIFLSTAEDGSYFFLVFSLIAIALSVYTFIKIRGLHKEYLKVWAQSMHSQHSAKMKNPVPQHHNQQRPITTSSSMFD